MNEKRAPGPIGTSCLTCKRRHKKCDQRRPTCLRCEQGGFECLGYGHNRNVGAKSSRLRASVRGSENDTHKVIRRLAIAGEHGYLEVEGATTDITSCSETTDTSTTSSQSSPFSEVSHGSPTFGHYTMPLINRSHPTLFESKATRLPVSTPLSLQQLFAAFSRIPSLPSDPMIAILSSPQFEDFVLLSHHRMIEHAYFKPIENQKEVMVNATLSSLRSSPISRWLVLLGAKFMTSLMEGTAQPQFYLSWIKDTEAIVKDRLSQNPTSREAHLLQADWLATLVTKSVLVPASNVIHVLRSTAPTFLQTAYSHPELWSDSSDPTRIPLLKIAASSYHELALFTIIDCTCAMAFGVPQQVEYDTTYSMLPKDPLPYEWAHSSPVEFLILLADINACRDGLSGARDWKQMEQELVTWMGRPTQHNETWESWMIVAWVAVQESWRLTLLAYLYMAVCGASSDEPRVQLCISQILQVIETVKKHDSPYASIPFFIQYLIVGICAHREKHRRIVRDKLSDKIGTKFWKFQVGEFVPVLDHLWHGAGSSGRPVKWFDYIHSREALVPIML
ncbi:hypothetical protein RSOLAG1IB_06481 [Rhizoctonia solani AG-1 IB]|uniref:Zn(2)-C6 fungal-type domain-containing protein n=1 Tax=Thanatephorus cucumeris (strain AG1-IB / isolate 7/3/14) TaxID=1108050 RepID=A0A0B7F6E0_THACB|nr:hypothetical protein RSOLAG1IB_06481 [Rhizoctonia solani AG-1 IB]